jgi:hypothetical protein
MIIKVTFAHSGNDAWSVLASQRDGLEDGGWCLYVRGNIVALAIGDPLDGDVVAAYLPSTGNVQVEWRAAGDAHEIWVDGQFGGRCISSLPLDAGGTLHVGSDPYFPRRGFAGHVQVEVIDG